MSDTLVRGLGLDYGAPGTEHKFLKEHGHDQFHDGPQMDFCSFLC